MPIPMTDLTAQYHNIKKEIDETIQRVVESGRFILGPEVETFEKEMAEYCGTRFAIGVASGTDALLISLLACGIKSGDEVITTPFTFIATAETVTHCGAIPRFVDIDPRTYNLDTAKIRSCITPHTRAIIPVHLFGQPADMDEILKIAAEHNLKVIEDCAQALSAEYRGRKVGSLGDAGCFSFFPAKNLGAFGDGGLITTNDPIVADIAKMLRAHGAKSSYYHVLSGYTSRLDALQAAILRVKLKHLDEWSRLRRERAQLYSDLLSKIGGVEPPFIAEYVVTSANYYTIRLKHHSDLRSELRKYLAARGIETTIYYPLSLHLQEVYNKLTFRRGDFPESEAAQDEVMSLPMYPEITEDQVRYIVNTIREFFDNQKN